jgi:hypothetical protein
MNHKRFIKIETTYQIQTKFWGHKDSEFVWIPIFKNAHSWGKYFFKLVADFQETENFLNKKYIVFLREPTERWYSGVAQWMYNNLEHKPFIYQIDPLMMRLIFNTIDIDGHTAPQTGFLKGLDLKKDSLYLFNIDDPLFEQKLKYFCAKHLQARFPKATIPPKNTADSVLCKEDIIQQLKRAAHEDPVYRSKILNYYEADYKLYKKADFFKDYQ